MTTLKFITSNLLPEARIIRRISKAYGMIPGLHGVLAGAPGILDAYQQLHELFVNSSFNEEELTVVWQSINVEHACHYCVPAHTGIAAMMKVDEAITEACVMKLL
jgi:hypothetical protein